MTQHATYEAFWRSLSHEHQEVIRQMDVHENLGHEETAEISEAMLEVLAKMWTNIGQLAEGLGKTEQEQDHHAETIMLILSFAPNGGSLWFIKELIQEQPELYDHLYSKVITQTPLQMYGKLLRERLLFHITREQIINRVYSPEVRLAAITALEALVREP
ncbi:hypothetical protein [Marinimicrobium sp. ABcell2]|uniref:type IVB secretion system protein IcmW n=1 Tax=Marinimicrobium sp. ABcell2 TaxID=3069751 RepID=UPI0027B6EFC4|nr:hypothetical protein [Marinimicrobium sp. ABcell2]MDQ2077525.1 hypothetical protein [Marinimicrobium sp. ABcell2]